MNKRKISGSITAEVVISLVIFSAIATSIWWYWSRHLDKQISSAVLNIAMNAMSQNANCNISITALGLDTYSPFVTQRTGKVWISIKGNQVSEDLYVTGDCLLSDCMPSMSTQNLLGSARYCFSEFNGSTENQYTQEGEKELPIE